MNMEEVPHPAASQVGCASKLCKWPRAASLHQGRTGNFSPQENPFRNAHQSSEKRAQPYFVLAATGRRAGPKVFASTHDCQDSLQKNSEGVDLLNVSA